MKTKDQSNSSEIRTVWLEFIKSLELLLVPQADDRPLDQYLAFRKATIELVTSEDFIGKFESIWNNPNDVNDILPYKVKEVLLLELKSFSPAVQIVATATTPSEKKSWWRSMLGRAGTTVDSVKDILQHMPPLLKGGLTY